MIWQRWNSRTDFVFNINVEYSFLLSNVKMHSDDGDNFIPITIYDNHGNSHETKDNMAIPCSEIGRAHV